MATFVGTTSTTEASSTPRQNAKYLRIILLGGVGKGKSSLGNSILGWQRFESRRQFDPITAKCSTDSCKRYLDDEMNQEFVIYVTDTPGYCSTRDDNDAVSQIIGEQIFKETSPGPHAILIVLRVDRFTPYDEEIIELIQSMFGPDAMKYCIFIFTHEDQLDSGDTIQKCVKRSNRMRSLMQQYHNRYLSINNTNVTEEKIKELIEMINKMVTENGNEYYTNTEYQRIEQLRQLEKKQKALEEEIKRLEIERLRAEKRNLDEELANERLRQKNHENASKQQSSITEDLYAGVKKLMSSGVDMGMYVFNKVVDHEFKKKEQTLSSASVLMVSSSQPISSPVVNDQLKASSSVPKVSGSTSEQIEVTSVRTTKSSVSKNSIPENFPHGIQYTHQSLPSPFNTFKDLSKSPTFEHSPLHSVLEFNPRFDPSTMYDPNTRCLMEILKKPSS